MRENYCMLFGQINKEPEISFDLDETGAKTYLLGIIEVLTCRSVLRTNKDGEQVEGNKWDSLTIFTRNPEIVKRDFVGLNKGDLVRIKGTISTRETIRKHYCKECAYWNEYPGIILYIDPLSVQKVASHVSDEDATLILQDAREHSNNVHLAGFVTMEPRFHEAEENDSRNVLEFSLAGNRIRRILEDEDTRRTDYPWIKLYGEQAKEYLGAFGRGYELYLNGHMQKRSPKLLRKCLRCGDEKEVETEIMEVVARDIQVIREPEEKRDVDEQMFDFSGSI